MMKKTWLSTAVLLLLATPLQAGEPPATLPKEFLAQLPLLMSLSEQEFESLLATTRQQNHNTESAAEEKAHED